jgi:hypothetical protein
MRVSRGLIGSLGAGVSLTAAGSLALLIVSAVVAFQGWPGVSRGTDGRPVTLPSSIRESAATSVPARIVLGGGVPAAAVRGGRGRREILLAGTAEQMAANPSPVSATSGATGGLAAAGPPSPAPAPPSVTTPPADHAVGPPVHVGGDAGATVQQATGGAGAAIQQTATGAGDAVRPVSPEAAGAVEQAGDAASGIVQGVGDGLGDLPGGH